MSLEALNVMMGSPDNVQSGKLPGDSPVPPPAGTATPPSTSGRGGHPGWGGEGWRGGGGHCLCEGRYSR